MSSSQSVLLFEVFRGADLVARERFEEQSVTIGSGGSALLTIEDQTVSDLHCVVNLEPNGSVMLMDLGSQQGTIFKGQKVQSATLASGDEFFVGILRVRLATVSSQAEEATDFSSDDNTDEVTENPPPAEAATPVHSSTRRRSNPPTPVQSVASPTPKKSSTPNFDEEGELSFEDDVIIEDGMSFVMRAGTATHKIGINDRRPKVLEVNQIWGDTLLDSRHFSQKLPQSVSIGSSLAHRWHFLGVDMGWIPAPLNMVLPYTPPMWSEVYSAWRNEFYNSEEDLPGGKDFDLFTFEDDKYVAHIHQGWDGFVDIGDQRLNFEQLVGAGRATAEGGGFAIPMDDDIRLAVDVNGVTYFAHKVAEASRLINRNSEDPDYPFIGIASFMAFLGLMFGLVMYFIPPRPSLGLNEIPDRFVEMTLEKPPEEEKKKEKPSGNPDAGEGAKAKREEGKTGKKDAKMEKAKGNKVEIQKAQKDRQIAENAGLLGALADDGGVDGAFASAALDSSLVGGVGGLIGAKGTQIGSGGLGSRGSGLGGGGSAEGLGGLGTKGLGSGKSGYGKGGGSFGKKGEGGIGAVGGSPIILGALDRSLIDAVVKRHMNQIRYCYQRELAKKPSLGGKIIIKFVISKDGTVSSASKKSSTMGNAAVEQCIVGRFMRMKFPMPKGGGIVIVSYPFIFSPG